MSAIWISVVDADYQPIKHANVSARDGEREIKLGKEDDRWIGDGPDNARLTIAVSADGYDSEELDVMLLDAITQSVIGLRKPGQLSYTQGNSRLAFTPIEDAFLARIRSQNDREKFVDFAKRRNFEWRLVLSGAEQQDDMFVRIAGKPESAEEWIEELSRNNFTVEIFRTIEHGKRTPIGLGKEIVVKFTNNVDRNQAEKIAQSVGLEVVRDLPHAGNAFVLATKGNASYRVLEAADMLARNDSVVYAEPNLTFAIEADVYTPNDPLWNQLPHLPLVDADDAWDLLDDVSINLRGGSPDITIGVIDINGVTPNHPDLTANLTDGTSKLVASMNFAASPIAAQTVAALSGDHGTQCAGSATAAFDNATGIAGVAPNCHLIGARIGGAANTVLMADIYLWVGGFLNASTAAGFPAAAPGRAADVISSSWGATGLALSNTIRDCFDFLATYGRGGKGCLLCFSLGNSGYGDFTDPAGSRFRAWPTYAKIIAVGASINTNPTNPVANSSHADPNGNTTNIATTVDTRALYSPFGPTALRKPDLVAPSHTAYGPNLIDPILSTVLVGTGGVNNDYATTFGGTSHATPVVAGAIALILSARPSLNWVQVRDVLRRTCARIDSAQANAIGQWQDLDGDGVIDYSRWYGAGRLDMDAAITRVLDPMLQLADVHVRENLSDTGAVPSGGSWWESPDIWVRQNAAEPIPALAWTAGPPHQNARRGQDNAVFCRVRNRGTAAAPVVYVRAMITHFAGLEFAYPGSFRPSNNVGAPLPSPLTPGTYLIGEARIDNLAVGADQIVKFTWPQTLIPPETVIVSGAPVHWHPCLLLEASPHDGPNPVTGLSVPVQGNNNIAQRNIAIIDAGDVGSDSFIGMIAGSAEKYGVTTLLVDASQLKGATAIKLHVADETMMKLLIDGAKRAERQQKPGERGRKHKCCAVILEDKARVRIECGDSSVTIEMLPGTRIPSYACGEAELFAVASVRHHGIEAVEISNLADEVEIPLRLDGGLYVPLLVAVDGKPLGDLRITQRRGDGQLSGGYGIRWIDKSDA
jgi:subtilisin family serine protease